MFQFQSEDNPFDLGIQQPIHCYKNGIVVARLLDSNGELKGAIEMLLDEFEPQNYEEIEQLEEWKGVFKEDEEEPEFGNPFCPADWLLVDEISDEKENYLTRLDICLSFLLQHKTFMEKSE